MMLVSLAGCARTSPPIVTTPPADARFPVFKNDEDHGRQLWGYIDGSGKLVIPYQFGEAHRFEEGFAVVWNQEAYCFIDKTGRPAFQLPGPCAFAFDFCEGLAAINLGGHFEVDYVEGGTWTYIDRAGKPIDGLSIPGKGDPAVQSFLQGLAAVRLPDKWGFIDRLGHVKIKPAFDETLGFSDGRAAVRIGRKWGFIDTSGKLVIPVNYDEVHPFTNGMAAIRADTEYAYIDTAGRTRIVLDGESDWWSQFSEGLAAVQLYPRGPVPAGTRCRICNELLTGKNFREPCPGCSIEIGDLHAGYIDASGAVKIPPGFEECRFFREGLAAAAIKDAKGRRLWGFIGRSGKWVIQPQFLRVFNAFQDGLCSVALDRGQSAKEIEEKDLLWDAYVDRTGKIIWESPH
jgi:hypothetical protein